MNYLVIKAGYSPLVTLFSIALESVGKGVRVLMADRRFFFLEVLEQDSFFRLNSASGFEYLDCGDSFPGDGERRSHLGMIPIPEKGSKEPVLLTTLEKSLYPFKMLPGVTYKNVGSVGFQKCLWLHMMGDAKNREILLSPQICPN